MVRRAECRCGLCSITVEGDPFVNGICHCDDCRKRTGSAFGWSAYFPDQQILEKSGETRSYKIPGNNPQIRHFCSRCGSTLFWSVDIMGELTGVAGGCFIDNPLPEPILSLRTEQACAWLKLPAHWERRP